MTATSGFGGEGEEVGILNETDQTPGWPGDYGNCQSNSRAVKAARSL